MRIKLIKAALAAGVDAAGITVPGVGKLNCYGYEPNNPSVPAFVVAEVVIDPFAAFAGGSGRTTKNVELTCRVIVSTADDQDGQGLLDDLISDEGPLSVIAALNSPAVRGAPGASALGGLCDDVTFIRQDGYRQVSWGGEDANYYAADLTVRLIGA